MTGDKDTVRAREGVLRVRARSGSRCTCATPAPSFLKVFVARGAAPRSSSGAAAVGDQLGQVRDAGEAAAEGRAAGAAARRRRRSPAVARPPRVRSAVLGGARRPTPTAPVTDRGGSRRRHGRSRDGLGHRDVTATGRLAIADYDELSASQVVDRLDGLERGDLDAIRSHEVAHRARRTILGKIDQLDAVRLSLRRWSTRGRATADDLPDLVELASHLRAELASYRGGALWATHDVGGEPAEVALTAAADVAGRRLVLVGTIDDVASATAS